MPRKEPPKVKPSEQASERGQEASKDPGAQGRSKHICSLEAGEGERAGKMS